LALAFFGEELLLEALMLMPAMPLSLSPPGEAERFAPSAVLPPLNRSTAGAVP